MREQLARWGRWWFAHRRTGEITVAQVPNWPIWCIGAAWIARLVAGDGSTLDGALGGAIRVLWCIWGADELVRGVNPWRRALGLGVLAWQVAAIAQLAT